MAGVREGGSERNANSASEGRTGLVESNKQSDNEVCGEISQDYLNFMPKRMDKREYDLEMTEKRRWKKM